MVDGVTARNQLTVHQALHGYSDGHREIASSVPLASRDARTVLIMSDLASAGSSVGESGYLTGYPLLELEHYAIARTWMAPEMSRPGCVWTHTLFISFAELGAVANTRNILAAFHRPAAGISADYDKPLTIETTPAEPLDLPNGATAWTRHLLSALYDNPTDKIVASAPADCDPDQIVLAIWLQQWSQMRKSFCFCTSTNSDRTTDRIWFDLQLLPKLDRGLRTRFPDAKFLMDMPQVPRRWVEHAMQDLQAPGEVLLRTFFQGVETKIPNGRMAFASLTELHQLLAEIPSRLEAVDEALKLLTSSVPNSAYGTARHVVMEHAAPFAASLSTEGLSFLVQNVSLLNEDMQRSHGESIARAVWTRAPDKFEQLLAASDTMCIESTNVVDALPAEELLDGIRLVPDLIGTVLARRPELAADPALWGAKGPLRDAAFRYLKEATELWPQTIKGMIASGASDLVQPAFGHFGAIAVWDEIAPALDASDDLQADMVRPWLALAVSDSSSVAQALTSGRIRTLRSLAEIARMTNPDDVPNDFGEDPWVSAVRNATGVLPNYVATYFMAYLLSRALGRRSRNCADLALIAFDTVYRAAGMGTMHDDAWALLEYRLPHVPYWTRWDRCDQLRHGMAHLFIERRLHEGAFGRLSQHDEVFEALAKAAVKNWGGNSYLRRVRQELSNADPERYAHRIAMLKDI